MYEFPTVAASGYMGPVKNVTVGNIHMMNNYLI